MLGPESMGKFYTGCIAVIWRKTAELFNGRIFSLVEEEDDDDVVEGNWLGVSWGEKMHRAVAKAIKTFVHVGGKRITEWRKNSQEIICLV